LPHTNSSTDSNPCALARANRGPSGVGISKLYIAVKQG